MPPKVKFQKEEIIHAALAVAGKRGIDTVTAREVARELGVSTRPIFTYYDTMDQLKKDVFDLAKDHYRAALKTAASKGMDAVTAREVAGELGVSTRPIFTWYDTMEQLKEDVYQMAKGHYRAYIERGLAEPVPFLGVGQQYIRFAKEEPELYKLLFLTRPDGTIGGAMEALAFSQDLVRESVMRIYHMDAHAADNYFRDLWLMAFSFATLIVTDDCPYTDDEMSAVFSEVSLAICKAYKEIPGLPEGTYDKDAIFRNLIKE